MTGSAPADDGNDHREKATMTDRRNDTPASRPAGEGGDASTLLPMLVGGLVLIMVGMVAVALIV